MQSIALVKDLMVPLNDYPVVRLEGTLLDAVRALKEAQQKLPQGRQPHRAVLIRDGSGAIVGKLGYFALLRALRPRQAELFSGKMIERSGISDDLMQQAMGHLSQFTDGLESVCEKARFIHLQDVMLPTTVQVQQNVPLIKTLEAFTENKTMSLLVYQGKEPVGVLRLSDVVEAISDHILACADEGNGQS